MKGDAACEFFDIMHKPLVCNMEEISYIGSDRTLQSSPWKVQIQASMEAICESRRHASSHGLLCTRLT